MSKKEQQNCSVQNCQKVKGTLKQRRKRKKELSSSKTVQQDVLMAYLIWEIEFLISCGLISKENWIKILTIKYYQVVQDSLLIPTPT